MDLRKQFVDNLIELAKKDKKIMLLACDLGYNFLERFAKKFPKQYLNVGAIEQSATGIAAGMAISGLRPYIYSGAVFLTMRNYEFVRNDVAYNNLNVKLIGTGASGFLGFSHNTNPKNEDELILKHLPNLKLHFPKTELDLKKVVKESYRNKKPSYIRL